MLRASPPRIRILPRGKESPEQVILRNLYKKNSEGPKTGNKSSKD